MAALSTTLHFHTSFNAHKTSSFPILTSTSKLKFRKSNIAQTLADTIHSISNSNSVDSVRYMSISNAFKQNRGNCCDQMNETLQYFMRWFEFIRDIFPGGSWWNLSDLERKNDGSPTAAEPLTVFTALSQMWELVADEKWILYIAFGALAVAAVSEISMPGILTASVFSAQNGEMLVFYQNSKLLIFLCFTSGICSGLRSGCFAIANMILVKRLRETVYSSLLLQDTSFFDTEAVGDLTSRISTDCQRLSHTIGNDMHLILRNILQGTGAFVTLMTLSWPLALSSLVVCFILSAIFLLYGQYQKKAALLTQDCVASANEVAQETLSLMRTIRAYGTEREEFQRFTQWLDRLAFVGMRESVAYGLWTLNFNTLYRTTQVFAVLLGGISILAGSVSAEQLIKTKIAKADRMCRLCERIFSLLFEEDGCTDPCRSLAYEQVPILKNVNFSIQANEVVAIVGVSGSGKSTLINLLLRLYEPICGEIFIDGRPLKEMDIRWLRQHIGFVGQEPHLFHMDVKSNITYGCFRSIGQEEIVFAAKSAYAHDFISALPSGYDTIIDDNLLSGGQKQRIAIARALLRDPTILILDEATSALDTESEAYIKDILHSLKEDSRRRTVIIIANRLSMIKAADRILVVNDGQVVEIGTHTELLQKNGQFARLFHKQTDAPSSIKHQKEGPLD